MGAFRVPPELVRLGARLTSRRALNPGLPWEVQRRRLDRLVSTWPPLRRNPVAVTSLNGVPAEVVSAGSDTGTTVVHFHGGGYCVGSPAESRDWAAQVSARAGCRMILPDYRLAPEHPYPAALADARAALAAVLDEAAGPVIVSGDSAGGGLALILAQDEAARARDQARERRDRAAPPGEAQDEMAGRDDARVPDPGARLAGCMLMSPWLDLTVDWAAEKELARRDVVLTPAWLRACADAYAGGEDRARREISPLHGDLAGLPPLLIQCGADDLLTPAADRLAVLARAAGVDVTSTRWPRLWHNFPLQPGLIAAADAAVAQTARFIDRVRVTRE